jgi:uncharacterized protein (DUF1697 family)
MAHVVLLRGVNVGGHRIFRPATFAAEMRRLGAVNVGAAGTFVIRESISRAELRAEFARRLPFSCEIVICPGREITRLMSSDAFPAHPPRAGEVRFVSVLVRGCRSTPDLPMRLPASGEWLLKLLARDGRYVFGVYRRHMKTIGYLGTLDRHFGVPVTTRNWNTMTAIARVLAASEGRRGLN